MAIGASASHAATDDARSHSRRRCGASDGPDRVERRIERALQRATRIGRDRPAARPATVGRSDGCGTRRTDRHADGLRGRRDRATAGASDASGTRPGRTGTGRRRRGPATSRRSSSRACRAGRRRAGRIATSLAAVVSRRRLIDPDVAGWPIVTSRPESSMIPLPGTATGGIGIGSGSAGPPPWTTPSFVGTRPWTSRTNHPRSVIRCRT